MFDVDFHLGETVEWGEDGESSRRGEEVGWAWCNYGDGRGRFSISVPVQTSN